ncbi:hypothetical protein ACIBTW_28095 [Micromonospora parva]|uniref:hypothetical protein n=1 Tax=Micromonospora parva TaxID=1464048 RepID=UPI0037ADAD80
MIALVELLQQRRSTSPTHSLLTAGRSIKVIAKMINCPVSYVPGGSSFSRCRRPAGFSPPSCCKDHA